MPNSMDTTNDLSSLPMHIMEAIFTYLDYDTWVKSLPFVSREWQTIRVTNRNIWRSFYVHYPRSCLWTHLMEESNLPLATAEHALSNFIADIAYDQDIRDKVTGLIQFKLWGYRPTLIIVQDFLKYLVAAFLEGYYPNKRTPENCQLLKTYLAGFNEQHCLSTLTNVLNAAPSLHQRIMSHDATLQVQDYFSLIQNMQHIEQIGRFIITLLVTHENHDVKYDDYLLRFLTAKWLAWLEECDLLALETQLDILDNLRIKWRDTKDEIKKNSQKLDADSELFFREANQCFAKLTESTILKLFFEVEYPEPEFILTCPSMLSTLSDLQFIKLTLATHKVDIPLLFVLKDYKQRLLRLPNRVSIFKQLVQNKVTFDNEVISQVDSKYIGNTFTIQILSQAEFIPLFRDEDLLDLTEEKFDTDDFISIAQCNPAFIERFSVSPTLILAFAKKHAKRGLAITLASYKLDDKHSLIDHFNLVQATELALINADTAKAVLNNSCLAAKIWEPVHLTLLQEKYQRTQLAPLIQNYLDRYYNLVKQAEKGEEKALTLILQKAIAYLTEQRVAQYLEFITIFHKGLMHDITSSITKRCDALHIQKLTEQAYETLFSLAISHHLAAARALLQHPNHLAKLVAENQLSKLLVSYPNLLQSWQVLREHLLVFFYHHPACLIEAYLPPKLSLSPYLALSQLMSFANHKMITFALIQHADLHVEWERLKNKIQAGVAITHEEQSYVDQFDQILALLDENDYVTLFTQQPSIGTTCPSLYLHLPANHPYVLEGAKQGKVPAVERLQQLVHDALPIQKFTEQAHESLVLLAITHQHLEAAKVLLQTPDHLAKLITENQLSKLLATHPNVLQSQVLPDHLLAYFDQHPECLIEAYLPPKLSLSPRLVLSGLLPFALTHKVITFALIKHAALHVEWERLKNNMQAGVTVTPEEQSYVTQFDQILALLDENDYVTLFTQQPSIGTTCPSLYLRLPANHPCVLEGAKQGKIPAIERLQKKMNADLRAQRFKTYLRDTSFFYQGYQQVKSVECRNKLETTHVNALSTIHYKKLALLLINGDHLIAESFFQSHDADQLLSIEVPTMMKLRAYCKQHLNLQEPFAQWLDRWEKTREKIKLLREQKVKVEHTIQQLSDYGTELDKKSQAHHKQHHAHRTTVYAAKSKAVKVLATDLKTISDDYFKQTLQHQPMNSRLLYEQLTQTIATHLEDETHADIKQYARWRSKLANYIINTLSWLLCSPAMGIRWLYTHHPVFRVPTHTEKYIKSEIELQLKEAILRPFGG